MSQATLLAPALVQVSFGEDLVEAVQDATGRVQASIRRICENVGLDYSSQLAKLKGRSWATVGMIATVAGDGKLRELTMIPADQIPMWMANVNEKKVSLEVRPRIVRYQAEAATVLSRHFLGPQFGVEATSGDHTLAMLDSIRAMLESVREVRVAQIDQERRLAVVEAKAEAALSIVNGDTGFMTLKGFCNVRKLKLTGAELSRAGFELTRQCAAAGVEIRSVPSERWGKENLYPVEALKAWVSANPI